MHHSWVKKGRWQRYGNYIYREDECVCGCVRRTVIDDEGVERTESYTQEEEVTLMAGNCRRDWDKQKRDKKNKRGVTFEDFTEWQPPPKEGEDYLIIHVP